MHQADQSVHKNLAFQLSDRQSAQKSSRNDHQQSNPQGTIDSTIQYESTNHYQSTNQQSDNKSNNEQIRHILGKQLERPRSKILLKQKDRYQNKSIQKGMFNNQQQSVNELKVVYKGSNSQLLSKDQSDSKIKRKPLKLSPIKNISGVQLLSKKQLNKTSELELPQKFERTTLQLPVRVKQIANFHQFVKQAMPVSKKLIGVLKRDRSGSKRLFPLLSLYMNQQLKYLLGSKRKACNLNSTYHIGTGNQPATQQDQEYVGTLKGNFLGTQFNFYDNSNNQKQILATISFINQISCKTVPRQIQVYVLSPFYKFGDLQGADTTNAHLNLKDLYVIGQNKQNRKILKFVNKKPIYDQARDQYFMDFHGKAQYSSVKNMILVDAENQNKEVFLIGKAGQDVFNFDAMFPLSPRIALAIASTSFDWKWASQ